MRTYSSCVGQLPVYKLKYTLTHIVEASPGTASHPILPTGRGLLKGVGPQRETTFPRSFGFSRM
jgi:hypothetical protein